MSLLSDVRRDMAEMGCLVMPASYKLPESTADWTEVLVSSYLNRHQRMRTLHEEPVVAAVKDISIGLCSTKYADVMLRRPGHKSTIGPFSLPVGLLAVNPANTRVLQEALRRDEKGRNKVLLSAPFGYNSQGV